MVRRTVRLAIRTNALVQLNAVLPALGVKDEPTGFEFDVIGPSVIRSHAMAVDRRPKTWGLA